MDSRLSTGVFVVPSDDPVKSMSGVATQNIKKMYENSGVTPEELTGYWECVYPRQYYKRMPAQMRNKVYFYTQVAKYDKMTLTERGLETARLVQNTFYHAHSEQIHMTHVSQALSTFWYGEKIIDFLVRAMGRERL